MTPLQQAQQYKRKTETLKDSVEQLELQCIGFLAGANRQVSMQAIAG